MTDHNKLIEALKEMCDPPIPDSDVELLKKVIQKLPIKGVDVEPLPVTENGVYTAEEGKAYSPVTVNVSGGSSELAKDLLERTKTVLDLRESGATSIGTMAFIMYDSLEDVLFPEGLTSIGDNAFSNCSSLALTSLPEGLTSIGDEAFYKCTSLALTSLPEGLTSIGDEAFYKCTSLALTSLPEGLTSIGEGTFEDCSSLESIIFKGNIESIGNGAFDGCTGITKYSFTNNSSVPSNSCQFSGMNENCKIVVPDILYDVWITATGWVNLAAHIIKQSEDV